LRLSEAGKHQQREKLVLTVEADAVSRFTKPQKTCIHIIILGWTKTSLHFYILRLA